MSVDRQATAGVGDTPPLDRRRIACMVATGLVLLLAAAMAYWTPWGLAHDGFDLRVYLEASRTVWSGGDPYGGIIPYIYSPVFAALIGPLTLLPFDAAAAIWRLGGLAALALAVRGSGPLGLAVFALPFLWASDLLSANAMAYATAAMIAVVRSPSFRTVTLYAVLVALIPKPQFLPVMIYGIVAVPGARRWVAVIGLSGVAMLAMPGYVANFARAAPIIGDAWIALPEPWTKLSAVGLTIAGLRFTRLLGPASVAMAPYLWPYALVPLGVSLVRGRRVGRVAGQRQP